MQPFTATPRRPRSLASINDDRLEPPKVSSGLVTLRSSRCPLGSDVHACGSSDRTLTVTSLRILPASRLALEQATMENPPPSAVHRSHSDDIVTVDGSGVETRKRTRSVSPEGRRRQRSASELVPAWNDSRFDPGPTTPLLDVETATCFSTVPDAEARVVPPGLVPVRFQGAVIHGRGELAKRVAARKRDSLVSPVRKLEQKVWMDRCHSNGAARKVARIESTPSARAGPNRLFRLPHPLMSPSVVSRADLNDDTLSPTHSPAPTSDTPFLSPFFPPTPSRTPTLPLRLDLGSLRPRVDDAPSRPGSEVFDPVRQSEAIVAKPLVGSEPATDAEDCLAPLPSRAGPLRHRRPRSLSAPSPHDGQLSSSPRPFVISTSISPYHKRRPSPLHIEHGPKSDLLLGLGVEFSSPLLPLPLSNYELIELHHSSLQRYTFPYDPSMRCSLVTSCWRPPITVHSLRELDLEGVLKNAQLRHDLVFDTGLMFRPNFDGERGIRKKLLGERYWTAIQREILNGCKCTTFNTGGEVLPCICDVVAGAGRALSSRIGPLILELRNIILSLLPREGTEDLLEMDKVTRGMLIRFLDPMAIEEALGGGKEVVELDFGAIVGFVGTTLKTHCAPMRDEMIEGMVKDFSDLQGKERREIAGIIVRGLRSCFDLVELMKLDVANHQLRTYRPHLIEQAIQFEVKSFENTLKLDLPLTRTKNWIRGAALASKASSEVEAIVQEGLLEVVFLSWSTSETTLLLPDTLALDSSRLSNLHADTTDLTIVYLLLLLFRTLVAPAKVSKLENEAMKKEIWCLLSRERFGRETTGTKGEMRGIEKLECAVWREEMKGVLLQVAARAQGILSPSSPSALSSGLSPPPHSTMNLVDGFFNTNFRPQAPLFLLLQKRLRLSMRCSIEHLLLQRGKEGGVLDWSKNDLPPLPSSTSLLPLVLGGCSTVRIVPLVQPGMMSSVAKSTAGEEELEQLLIKFGLDPLAEELRLVSDKLSKVIDFHTRVYGAWYGELLRE